MTNKASLCACIVAALFFSTGVAHAAVAQQVQSGTAVNTANGIQVITISGVDPAKSFLMFGTRSNSNRPVGSTVRGRLPTACANPCTTIEFERVTDGVAPEPAPINIQWYVVTFGSGVKVQRGETLQDVAGKTQAITAVAAMNQAFVLHSKTAVAGDSAWENDDAVLVELTNTTTLTFRSNAVSGHVVAWQVVEFTNAADINVQRGSILTMTGVTTSVTATLSPAVNVNKTFVLIGWQTSSTGIGPDIGARMLRAQLTNSTTITIDRSASGSPDNIDEISWQAIELKDASIVWSGSANFPIGVSQVTAVLGSPANTTRSVAFMSSQGGNGQSMGRSPYVGDDIIGVASATASLGIAFRAAASAGAGNAVLTLTINKPAGTVENDVMVASIGVRPNTAVITPPAGWSLVRRTDNASGNSLAVYTLAAGAAEPATYAWTFDTSAGSAGGIQAFSGVDTANPVDVELGQTTASALTHSAPTVTTRAANEMIVTAHTFSSSATWLPPAVAPAMAEAFDVASQALGNAGQSIEGNYLMQSVAGATGVNTATASGNADFGNTQTLALRPANSTVWLTLDRNNTVDTADVGWFVVQFNQSAGFKVGSLTKSTTVAGCPAACTNVIAHGLGEVPKAIILWTDGKTNEAFSGSHLYGFGMTDGTTSRSVAAASQDAVATSNTSSRMASKALTIVQWGETLLAEADLASWDDTNFTLSWTTNNNQPYVIHYMVIGGSDISAKVVEWTMATAVNANYPVVGVGFRPNVVIHANAGYLFTGASGTNLAGATLGLGAMDADGNQWAVSQYAVDNSGLADTQRGQQTNGTIYSFNNALAVQKKASMVSMDADGFTLNFTNATSALASRVFSLALKGLNGQVGSFNKIASPSVSQTISGMGFQPGAVLLTSFQDVTQASPVAHGRFGIGASDGGTEGSSTFTDENPPTTTNVDAIDKTSKVFMKANNTTATIDAEADLTTVSNGFTLGWTANDAATTEILYLAMAPINVTAVTLTSLTATRYNGGVLVDWRTGYEIDNLGFHVYREVNGERTRVTRSPVAGSGLMTGHGVAVHAEQRYAFWDLDAAAADTTAVYWLEDLDFDGTSTLHGPVTPVAGGLNAPPTVASSTSLREVGKGSKRHGKVFLTQGGQLERTRNTKLTSRSAAVSTPIETQWALAAQSAIKIGITHAGWYRVTQPELVAAGLDPRVKPRTLRLYAEGVEHAILVTGKTDGRFDAADAVEFYGTGLDTPYTDARVYWLVSGDSPGRRIAVRDRPVRGADRGPSSFWFTVQHKDRSGFFPALENGDAENWFGEFVAADEPAEIIVNVPNLDRTAVSPAELEVTLQGVTSNPAVALDHGVTVLVNGTEVGQLLFDGQMLATQTFAVPAAVLRDGDNSINLIATGGDADYTYVDTVRLSYWHTYQADADLLASTADGPGLLTVGGFASRAIRLVDISDPDGVEELQGLVGTDRNGLASITARMAGSAVRTLFSFSESTIASPAFVRASHPSTWHDATQAYDYVAISHGTFYDAADQLVSLRARQGLKATVVNIEDIYNEYSFGEKTPQALKDFVNRAKTNWKKAPRFVTLIGDATIDPRDYAGFGDADFVPTKQIPMNRVSLETASDDWFVDVDDDGLPDMAIGRLPARTLDQAKAMVTKTERYEVEGDAPWMKDILFVADHDDSTDPFEAATRQLEALLPAGYRGHEVFSSLLGSDGVRESLANQVAEGRLIVNYSGHGSVQVWGHEGDLLTPDDVAVWTNALRLPFIIAMNCLNGMFQGIYGEESLAETLLRAPQGGAVAVWASSSVTDTSAQAVANQELFRLIFQGRLTVGEAVAAAKRVVPNRDIRQSWIFFGDPAMRLRGVQPPAAPATETASTPVVTSNRSTASQDDNTTAASDRVKDALADRVRLADFTGDGRDDLWLYARESGAWRAQLSDAGPLVQAVGQWGPGLQITAARLNEDAAADLVFYRPTTGEWIETLNAGTGRFTVRASGTGAPDQQVVLADFTGDGRDDRLMYDPRTGTVAVTTHDKTGDVTERPRAWMAGVHLLIGDFNGDGLADLVGYDAQTGRGFVALRTKTDFTLVTTQWGAGWALTTARTSDSRRSDLVFYNPQTGAARLGASDGRGNFTYQTRTWPAGLVVQAADLDGVGRDGLFGYSPQSGVWLAVTFSPRGVSEVTGQWTAGWHVATADLNGDGRTDIVLYDPVTGLGFRCYSLSPGVFEYRPDVLAPGASFVGRPQ